MFRNAVQFLKDAYAELRLVHWLTRKQAIASTVLVLGITILVSIYISGVDFLLLMVTKIFVGAR